MPGKALTFFEFCLRVLLPVLQRANGRATTRWLDNVNTDNDYRNYCINNTMDNNTNDSQGRPAGGGVQTRSRAVTGTRRATRAKTPTPRGPRRSRTPASVAKATPKDAETTGAPGSAEAKACTPEPVNVEGLGVPVRTRRPKTARASVAAPAAKDAGPGASGSPCRPFGPDATAAPNGPSRCSWEPAGTRPRRPSLALAGRQPSRCCS